MTGLDIERWSFWSPESTDPAAWAAHWSRTGAAPADGEPPTERIAPMQRRRMSRLSKMALSVALDVAAGESFDYSIFCSQHGEIVRTRQILSSIVAEEEISPTAFAQSVHNTASGLYTILEKSNAASTSIASGPDSFAYAWLEAESWLADNPGHRVLLVDFDEIIPAEYRAFTKNVDCDHALALVLGAATADGVRLSRAEGAADCGLPLGPQFLAWLQGDDSGITLGVDGRSWRWAR